MLMENKEPPYMINIGRPSYFSEEDFKSWSDFFTYVEETDILIKVNAQYPNMKQMCENRQGYGGGGFKFCFWFDTKEDRRQFLKDLENKLGWDKYRDYEKVTLHQDLDKKMSVRMIPELAEAASEYLKDNVVFELTESYGWNMINVEQADIIWLYKLNDHLNDVLLDMD